MSLDKKKDEMSFFEPFWVEKIWIIKKFVENIQD